MFQIQHKDLRLLLNSFLEKVSRVSMLMVEMYERELIMNVSK